MGLLLLFIALPIVAQEWVYTVRPGDNIWNLTKKYCTSVRYWKKVERHNKLKPDQYIPPGTKLRFPLAWLKHQPASAQVTQLTGKAEVMRVQSGIKVALTLDTELNSGDLIRTAPDGSLTLRFADGSELLVQGGSELKLDHLSAYGSTGMVDTRVRLERGRVDTKVKPSKGFGSRYHIITPAAVAAVRGTLFRVSADNNGSAITRSEVLEGEVKVSGASESQLVPAGFGIVAEAGKPPAPPKKLLPAPQLSRLQTHFDTLPLQFTWLALPGAQNYRLQIAPDEQFNRLLADAVVSAPTGHLTDLPDGDYRLRVRGIDSSGLEGYNTVRAFVVDAKPEPPQLVGLVDDHLMREPQPEFHWFQPEAAEGYHFQLARDKNFQELVMEREQQQENSLQLETPLPPGFFYWRIAAWDAQGRGPFSDPQRFEYRPKPHPPELLATVLGEERLLFRWKSAGDDMRYQFQLATDQNFKQIVTEKSVESTQLTIFRPVARHYYFRLRTLERDGDASPYGRVHEIDVPVDNYWSLLVLLLLFL
ncbi:MAG: FecR domain-containing protein [Candidatus Polarisedimenticolaceae bacterium]|nr:FecR domain-containing protein [Candidatus Polarisedimenticolaceae bacterium]